MSRPQVETVKDPNIRMALNALWAEIERLRQQLAALQAAS